MAGPHPGSRRVRVAACAVLACTVLACTALTACGGAERSGPRPPSSSPTASRSASGEPAAERLVLRWRRTGGLAGIGGPGSVPEFSLYSSGRAVAAAERPDSRPPDRELTQYRLKPQALQRLLDGARAAGFDRSHTVGSDQIADAVVTVVAMGDAETRIIEPGRPGSRESLFLKQLAPEGWPADDQSAPPEPYTPQRTAVLAGEITGEGTARPWPLGPLGDGVRAAGAICTLAPSAKVPETRPGTPWRSDGTTYSVRLRPLLPAEDSCEDLD